MQIYRYPRQFLKKYNDIISAQHAEDFMTDKWDKYLYELVEFYLPSIAELEGVQYWDMICQSVEGNGRTYLVISNLIELNALKQYAEFINDENSWLNQYESRFLFNNWR